MPYAINSHDGVRSYYEDWGGDGPPVLVYTGLGDPLAHAQQIPLVHTLAPEYRMIFADHRGHGRSDKPHEEDAYKLTTRVDDAVAVLDEVGVQQAHVLGFSWGARLGFAIGEHAADRVRSLVLCGNQPYAWDPRWQFARKLSEALDTTRDRGMEGFLEVLEASFGGRINDPDREWVLVNDPVAIRAAWYSAMSEGAVSRDLSTWQLPCLIYMAEGEEMYDHAARAAEEIPGSRFLALEGHTHLSAPQELDQVLPAVRALWKDTGRRR